MGLFFEGKNSYYDRRNTVGFNKLKAGLKNDSFTHIEWPRFCRNLYICPYPKYVSSFGFVSMSSNISLSIAGVIMNSIITLLSYLRFAKK